MPVNLSAGVCLGGGGGCYGAHSSHAYPLGTLSHPASGIEYPTGTYREWNTNLGQFGYLETHSFVLPASTSWSEDDFISLTWDADVNATDWMVLYGKESAEVKGTAADPFMWEYDADSDRFDLPAHLTMIPIWSDGTVDTYSAYSIYISRDHDAATPVLPTGLEMHLREGPPVNGIPTAECYQGNGCHFWIMPSWSCESNDSSSLLSCDTIILKSSLYDFAQFSQASASPVDLTIYVDGDIYVPLSHAYARVRVQSGSDNQSRCRQAVDELQRTFNNAPIGYEPPALPVFQNCNVESQQYNSAAGMGRVAIRGFGRVNAYYTTQSYTGIMRLPRPPDSGQLTSFLSYMDHNIRTGIVMLGTEAVTDCAGGEFAIDISGISVVWAPKRNSGTVLLNAYLAMDAPTNTNDACVRLHDFKQVANWVDATDGPEVLGRNSYFEKLYLHVNDDTLKLAARNLQSKFTTVIQGNSGGVVNLGSYGWSSGVEGLKATQIYVHRIVQMDAQEDQRGGLIAIRNCPSVYPVSQATVSKMHVACLRSRKQQKDGKVCDSSTNPNAVSRAFAIGNIGGTNAGQNSRNEFCPNADGRVSIISDIKFLDFSIQVNPSYPNYIYNDPPRGTESASKVEWIYFNDGHGPLFKDDSTAESCWLPETATRISPTGNSEYAYFVCGEPNDPGLCVEETCMGGHCSMSQRNTSHALNVEYFAPASGAAPFPAEMRFPYDLSGTPQCEPQHV